MRTKLFSKNKDEDNDQIQWIYVDLFKDSTEFNSKSNRSYWQSEPPFVNNLSVVKNINNISYQQDDNLFNQDTSNEKIKN